MADLNRVQEHVVKGGFQRMGESNKSKAVRELTNIRMNVLVNQGMWKLMKQFDIK